VYVYVYVYVSVSVSQPSRMIKASKLHRRL